MLVSNIDRIVNAWKKRERAIKLFMQKATAEATKTLLEESRLNIRHMIYDKPVPTRAQVAAEKGLLGKTGKIGVAFAAKNKSVGFVTSKKWGKRPAWTRTGNLRRSEHSVIASAYVGLVINDVVRKDKKGGKYGYARRRHDMESRYPAPFRQKAINSKRMVIKKIYRDAFDEALKQGAVFSL